MMSRNLNLLLNINMILFAFFVTLVSLCSSELVNEVFLYQIEIVASRIETEDRHLVAPFLDSGLTSFGQQTDVCGNELLAHLVPDVFASSFQLLHELAAELFGVLVANGIWNWLERVADGNRDWYMRVFKCQGVGWFFSLVLVTDCFKIVKDRVLIGFCECFGFRWVACVFTRQLLDVSLLPVFSWL